MILVHLFSIEELDALDEKQLHILRHVVEKEILTHVLTHPELGRVLSERAHERYNEFRIRDRPRRARSTRTPPGT
jgi:hypothetical protein